MGIRDSWRNFLGSSSPPEGDSASGAVGGAGATSPDERATVLDGGQIVAGGDQQLAIEIPEDSDVDVDRIEAVLNGNAGSVGVRGQTGGGTTVTPVASGSDIHITDSAFDLSDWEYKAHLDDQIKNLMANRVDYNSQTGEWILANDDLVPGVLIRLKSLLMGEKGLIVEPKDPDDQQDKRLATHMEAIYAGDPGVETHVDPGKVVDRILEQNVMNAVFVGRSTDLQHLDVDTLSYVKDGETGDEIYIQDPTTYTTFEVSEDGEPTVGYGTKDETTALEIGEHVLDLRMYRTPPLQAVADDIVNKLQLKRLQGRKAELASIGGIIIKVNPPAWLDEEDYGNFIRAEDDEFGDEDGRLLELVMEQQIDAALDTLESYQTATVMSIPENWETDTIELPEMDESMSSMIRDYNEAVSRRLLLPLDLIELKEGPELSRDSMMAMFLDQVHGWQGMVTDLFDAFAQIQGDVHDVPGEVSHRLPTVGKEDEWELVQLLNFAGLLGMSETESRELVNHLEGVDLEPRDDAGLPPDGGPDDPKKREDDSRQFLKNPPGFNSSAPNHAPEGGSSGVEPGVNGGGTGLQDGDSGVTRADVLAAVGLDGEDAEAAGFPMDPDQWPPRATRAAWDNVGASLDSCMAHMVTEAGWDDRKAQAFCEQLQGSLHAQTPLSIFDSEGKSASESASDSESDQLPTRQELLANIPGVDDPEVGFKPGEPEGWDRTSVEKAWNSLGRSWTSCYQRMKVEMGPRMGKRWCAALKDEYLGTEEWRGGDGADAAAYLAVLEAEEMLDLAEEQAPSEIETDAESHPEEAEEPEEPEGSDDEEEPGEPEE